ncbi:hypothetical protein [Candidatus Pelagibacter sp. HIMB1709]|uniref:hypothetical protein n=1 Tax=Candidatus Pelagibacter sp. HIMB1709 TaxID=3413367 RepID=UPI003F82A88D
MIVIRKIIRLCLFSLILFLIVVSFDLLINFFLPENIKKNIGVTKNYSLKSKKFHHEIAPNIDVYEFWGEKKYKVVTNQYGMRINTNNTYDDNKKNIGFMGDSFVYGSGIKFEDHFINHIKNQNSNFNYLNLGYVSYSPSIYYKKIIHFVKNENLKFDKIFLFIDTSDIQDEGLFYREDKYGNIVRKWNTDEEVKFKNFKYFFKNYLKQNSFVFKFYEIFGLNSVNERSQLCLDKKNSIKNFKKFLDYERFGYAFNDEINLSDWAINGQIKTLNYLTKIKNFLDMNKIELLIVYYPSAIDVLEGNYNKIQSRHYNLLNSWSKENNVTFIDTNEDFFISSDPIKNYKENHIICDIHWNSGGHKIIAKHIIGNLKNN